jgi:hypothetical protein
MEAENKSSVWMLLVHTGTRNKLTIIIFTPSTIYAPTFFQRKDLVCRSVIVPARHLLKITIIVVTHGVVVGNEHINIYALMYMRAGPGDRKYPENISYCYFTCVSRPLHSYYCTHVSGAK